MICKRCGRKHGPAARFCADCGAPLGAPFPIGNSCPACGKVNVEGALFCAGCGTPLRTNDPYQEKAKHYSSAPRNPEAVRQEPKAMRETPGAAHRTPANSVNSQTTILQEETIGVDQNRFEGMVPPAKDRAGARTAQPAPEDRDDMQRVMADASADKVDRKDESGEKDIEQMARAAGAEAGAGTVKNEPDSENNMDRMAHAAGETAEKAKKAAAHFGEYVSKTGMLSMLKRSFTAPADAVQLGQEEGDKWLLSVITSVLKALLAALIVAGGLRAMVVAQVGAELYNSYKDEVFEQLGFSFAGLGALIFVLFLVSDAVTIFCPLGIGKAFGGHPRPKNWLSAVCPAFLGSACGTVLSTAIIMASFSALQSGRGMGGVIFAAILFMIAVIWQIVLLWKAFEKEMKLSQNKSVFAFVISMTVSSLIAMLLVWAVISTYMKNLNLTNMV